jgi:septum formation protein
VLILASASPRRAELLSSAGFTFTIRAADVDEAAHEGEAPEDYVRRVAAAKARAVAAKAGTNGTFVLGADTIVLCGGQILGKPRGPEDAARMLRMLSGTVHEVLTAIVLVAGSHEDADVVRTRVFVAPLSPAEIEWYVSSGEPEGKAGAYAIQGRAARFIERIEGSWSNVVGLPVATVHQMLKRAGA